MTACYFWKVPGMLPVILCSRSPVLRVIPYLENPSRTRMQQVTDTMQCLFTWATDNDLTPAKKVTESTHYYAFNFTSLCKMNAQKQKCL